jgi:hypothetical protein
MKHFLFTVKMDDNAHALEGLIVDLPPRTTQMVMIKLCLSSELFLSFSHSLLSPSSRSPSNLRLLNAFS